VTAETNPYVRLCLPLLGLGILAELARLVVDVPWYGYADWISDVVSMTLILVWALTAVTLLTRRKSRGVSKLAWLGSIASPFVMLAHAVVTTVGGARAGLLYLPLCIVLVFFLRRMWAWHGELRRNEPEHHPARLGLEQ
jgi:hypothetical protein